MATQYSFGKIVTDGLVLCLDAADRNSYVSGSLTWRDVAGSNNGTLTNGPTFNSTNGGSIVFDGVDDYVDCGNISSIILSNNQFTANYWFRMTGTARGDLFGIKNFNTPQDDIGFFIDISNKLNAYFNIQGVITNNIPGTGYASISNTTFARNTIYNIVCMKDASQKIVMYVNGVLDNNTYSTITNTSNVAITPFWVASNKTGPTTPAVPFSGNIFSAQIYNRALSALEVLQNYNSQKSRFGLS
jgi:hypothetical protein